MALKALSGVFRPKKGFTDGGSVTIDFDTHSVTGDCWDPRPGDRQDINLNRKFASEPTKHVSLHQLLHIWIDKNNPGPVPNVEQWNLDDYFTTRTGKDGLVITWRAGGGVELQEIAYQVVGECK